MHHVKRSTVQIKTSRRAPNQLLQARLVIPSAPLTKHDLKSSTSITVKPTSAQLATRGKKAGCDLHQGRISKVSRHEGYKSRMRSHIQFITTPTYDTPGSALILHFDDRRYVVGNFHEGLQRAGLEMGAKFLKAKNFLVTGKTDWSTHGGMIGMILTLADATKASAVSHRDAARLKVERARAREEEEANRKRKKSGKKNTSATSNSSDPSSIPPSTAKEMTLANEDPSLRIHGGPNLMHTLATARAFIFRQGMPINVNEHVEEEGKTAADRDWEPTWRDDRVQVWTMSISPSKSETSSPDQIPVSPRKRSLSDFMSEQRPSRDEIPEQRETQPSHLVSTNGKIIPEARDQWTTQPPKREDTKERKQQIRESAISEMFQSKWEMDSLVETRLREVNMPASIFVRDPQTKKLEKYQGPSPDTSDPIPDIEVLVRTPWPAAHVEHLPSTENSTIAISYIIRNHKQRGKFRTDAARAHKVPPGPLWRDLAMGQEVQSSEGMTVTSDMVLEPSKEGAGVAVIDLPSTDYVRNLVERPEWKAERVMTGVGAIVWLLGPGVSQDKSLLQFIDDHKDLKHIVSSPDYCSNHLSMTSAAASALRRRQVDQARHPILQYSNELPTDLRAHFGEEEQVSGHVLARQGLLLQLEPALKLINDHVVEFLNTPRVLQGVPEAVRKLAQDAKRDINSKQVQADLASQNLPSPNAEIICLGTGSALPSLERNVSATLLRVPGCGSYLLDCGENTLGQLRRIYSPPELAKVLQDLKMIWISHLHGDHHLGTTSVIKAWYEEVHGKNVVKRRRPPLTKQILHPEHYLNEGKRLFIVGHGLMMRWLDEYSSVEDFGYDQIIPLTPRWDSNFSNLKWNGAEVGFNTADNTDIKDAIRKATGLENLQACPVSHCYGSQAVVLEFPTGFKLSYSGDCRPSNAFAKIGRGSTVLVHEATFDDELKGDAVAKKHSTTSEAIGVGVAMGARRIILTHFSQRYSKIPSMDAVNAGAVKLEDAEDVEGEEAADLPMEDDTAVPKTGMNDGNTTTDDPIPDAPDSQDPITQPHLSPAPTTNKELPTEPRTPQPAPLLPQPANTDLKIAVAFDYMRVRVHDIALLERFTPAFRELYKAEEEETAARQGKQVLSDPNQKIAQSIRVREVQQKAGRKKEENPRKWEDERAKGAEMESEKKREWESDKAENEAMRARAAQLTASRKKRESQRSSFFNDPKRAPLQEAETQPASEKKHPNVEQLLDSGADASFPRPPKLSHEAV